MTIAMEVEMVLIEKGDELCIYEEMIDVQSGDRKLDKPICIQSCAFDGDAPQIVTLRIEVTPSPKPTLNSGANNTLPPVVA